MYLWAKLSIWSQNGSCSAHALRIFPQGPSPLPVVKAPTLKLWRVMSVQVLIVPMVCHQFVNPPGHYSNFGDICMCTKAGQSMPCNVPGS